MEIAKRAASVLRGGFFYSLKRYTMPTAFPHFGGGSSE